MKTKKQRLIKLGVTTIVFCAIFIVASVIKVKAGTTDNTSGWLWGGSDDGTGNNTGVGWLSMNNINPGIVPQGSVSYGVNIPSTDGNLSGYAWSGGIDSNDQGLGWISFQESAGCPSGSCNAQRSGNDLIGWARIMSIPQNLAQAGGWSGWISLNSKNCDTDSNGFIDSGNCGGNDNSTTPVVSYKVTIANVGTLSGYGWSNELGWIDFSRSSTAATACTYSGYVCIKDNVDCGNVSNCGKTNFATCTANNSCTGSEPIALPNSNCDLSGICTPSTATCPPCTTTGVLKPGTWKEVAP